MNRPRHRFLADPAFAVALGLGPACWLLMGTAGLARWPQWLDSLTGQWLPDIALSAVLLGVLIMPILEEIVFRQGLQGWLLEVARLAHRKAGISGANLCTSVAFSAMHLINHPPALALAVFLPSLVFGWARDRYQAVIPSILLHAFYNAGYLLFTT